MGLSENKAVWQHIIDEVLNGRRLELTDALFADDHELHPETPGSVAVLGRQGRRELGA